MAVAVKGSGKTGARSDLGCDADRSPVDTGEIQISSEFDKFVLESSSFVDCISKFLEFFHAANEDRIALGTLLRDVLEVANRFFEFCDDSSDLLVGNGGIGQIAFSFRAHLNKRCVALFGVEEGTVGSRVVHSLLEVSFVDNRGGESIASRDEVEDRFAVFVADKGDAVNRLFGDVFAALVNCRTVFSGQIEGCCGICRDSCVVGVIVSCEHPTAFDGAVGGIVIAFCAGQAAAKGRLEDKRLVARSVFVAFDAEDVTEHPLCD